MTTKWSLILALLVGLHVELAAYPHASAERKDYLERVNHELNFWEEVIERERGEYERGAIGGQRDKALQDLELLARDTRGLLLKLGPASRDTWSSTYPIVEEQLTQLRAGFADLP